MAITTDERPFDMKGWVSEKSDSVLSEACRIVDWLRHMAPEMSQRDSEQLRDSLHPLIFNAAKLFCFGHENINAWSVEWAEVMFEQGYERFLEFQECVTGRVLIDTPASRWRLSVQRVFDRFGEMERCLAQSTDEEKSFVRSDVLSFANWLRDSEFSFLYDGAGKMLELLDQEAFMGTITWQNFVRTCSELIEAERRAFCQWVEDTCDPWG